MSDANAIYSELRLLGIQTMTVHYAGGGDEGHVNEIEAKGADGIIDVDKLLLGQVPDTVARKLLGQDIENIRSERIRDLVYDLLQANPDIGDWINNEGGSGNIEFEFRENGEVDVTYNHTEGEYEEYEDEEE